MMSSAIAVALLFSQAAGEAATQPAKPDPLDRVKCRSVAPIDSIIPKRTCRTLREWKAISDRTSSETRRQMETESMSGGSNTGG
jgi:hypothetical protein